ncbi:MAG: porphobilinogen synthase [Nevskiaceae bacterium]|nr:MAG: porphobilinogen synthase [Nevskiaceae bacterium]TBR72711.1 MAG: porphobilinogen synthase [Nevskiaceae bacterium]
MINQIFPATRARRLRQAPFIRELVRETRLAPGQLIQPLFVAETEEAGAIATMPGQQRYTLKDLAKEGKQLAKLGVSAVALFPALNAKLKNATGTEALNPKGLIPRAIGTLKAAAPELGVICDVALDPYTNHGHDGVLTDDGRIENDTSVELLRQQALLLARAGADVVAPSDMMDGRIGTIRTVLERDSRKDTLILAYSAKYASAFYGPFRDAVGSKAALKGDKRTYQMDPANTDEALREVALDIAEGADMVMVKPALPYLDIIRRVKDEFSMPTFAYQVSGEYAMLKTAAANGWLDEKKVVLEALLSIRRAGADAILTYFAKDVAGWLD